MPVSAITEQFYTSLPLHEIPISELLAEERWFNPVPEDWQVVITDIKNSTLAVNEGLHQVVNLIATGSIIAALNIARKKNIHVPFFFGGDGATLLIPPSLLDPVMHALDEHRENTFQNFALELRVGHVPVTEIMERGYDLLISKVKVGPVLSIPIVLGDGLRYAESVVKENDFVSYRPRLEKDTLNLEGMECRWDSIKAPASRLEIVCLLVNVCGGQTHSVVFHKVLSKIDEIYGPQQQRHPIATSRLRLKATLGKISTEMRTRLGKFNLVYLIRNFLATLFGRFYFLYYQTGKEYLHNIVALSDTLVIDGRINTIISGTFRQREELIEALDAMEKDGTLCYGIFVSKESIMSCYVRDRLNQHIHFVDGAEGGYTRAAGMLKKKLSKQ